MGIVSGCLSSHLRRESSDRNLFLTLEIFFQLPRSKYLDLLSVTEEKMNLFKERHYRLLI